MRCEDFRHLLILADDGELGPLAAWRVRRHLAACPDCAAERAEFARLDARLRAADVANGFGGAHLSDSRPAPVAAARPRRRLVLGAAASAAALAALGAAVVFAPGQIGSPSVAFAQVEEAMGRIRNAEWSLTEVWRLDTGEPGRDGPNTVSKTRVRARLDPPALLFEREGKTSGSDYVGESRFRSVSLKTPAYFRTYRADLGEITEMPYSHGDAASRAEGLRAEIRGNLMTRLGGAQAGSGPPPDETRRVTLDGRPALRFTFRATPDVKPPRRITFTLWADADTKRVLRTAMRDEDAATGRVTYERITENIRYDVSVPDSAFSLNAPAGTPVYHEDHMLTSGPSAALTPEEKKRVNALIDRTYAGILASDWERASAGWDLAFASSLPGSPVPPGGLERILREKVAAGRKYKLMRRLAVSGINAAPYVRVMGYGDAIVAPAGKDEVVAVTLTPGILYRDDFQEIGTETFFFRRVGKNDFRIVGWQYPERQRARWRSQWLADRAAKRSGGAAANAPRK